MGEAARDAGDDTQQLPSRQPSEHTSLDAGDDAAQADAGAITPLALGIEPASATLVVRSRSEAATQTFHARLSSDAKDVVVRWRVDGDLVSVDADGVVKTRGLRAGTATLTAYYGDLTAQAQITVSTELHEDVGTVAVSDTNRAALDGPPTADPGLAAQPANPTKVLYPYDGTVMPRGLSAPVLQLSPGTLPPEDLKVIVETTGFSWQGYAHVDTSAKPRVELPQDIWDAAHESAAGGKIRVRTVKAVAGKAYGPFEIEIVAANGTLKGAVYYMTYEGSALGLWSVRPGVREPPKHIVSGCVVCHSASSNGTRLSTGADQASVAAQSGVYSVDASGNATQITGAPTDFGGDSRGLSYATFTPDGRYVMRSDNNFWGGVNQRAFFIDDAQKKLVEATVVGLGSNVSAYLPAFSHDGKRYAFTNGAGEAPTFGTVGRSLSVMDVAVDASAGQGGTLSFSNRKLVLDHGANGSVVKFATFMPDANQLVFQEGEGYTKGFNEMLPTWGSNSSYTTSTGRLGMVRMDHDDEEIELARLNAGNVAIDADRNYEPFALPVTVGGYFWVVFTSIREYGNTYTGSGVRKQLWVAAISPDAPKGQDPSHPPFYLPNQGETRNERGFWALEPCRADGSSCESGDECCGGFCRPADPTKPELGSVCMPPDDLACAELHERCEVTADCCGAADGAQCIGGYCDVPAPPAPECVELGGACEHDGDCCDVKDGVTCLAKKCSMLVVK